MYLRALFRRHLGLVACRFGRLLRRLDLFPKRGRALLVLPRRHIGLAPEALDLRLQGQALVPLGACRLGFASELLKFRLRGVEARFVLPRRRLGLMSCGFGRLLCCFDLMAKCGRAPFVLLCQLLGLAPEALHLDLEG